MQTAHAFGPPVSQSIPEPELCGARRSDGCRESRPSPGRAPQHPPRLPAARARKTGHGDRLCLRPPRPPVLPAFAWLTLLASALLRPAAAAFVSFENCLPESYVNNEPTPLQWVPHSVDASFDTTDPKHTLRVTMWGNVTGSFTNVALPPPGSPDWDDPSKTDGKIVNGPEPDSPNPKLTTLHSNVKVLTYEPWCNNTNFCETSLVNGSCPLGPVFDVDPR